MTEGLSYRHDYVINKELFDFELKLLFPWQPCSQGLSSYRPLGRARSGKTRDPGNEVVTLKEIPGA